MFQLSAMRCLKSTLACMKHISRTAKVQVRLQSRVVRCRSLLQRQWQCHQSGQRPRSFKVMARLLACRLHRSSTLSDRQMHLRPSHCKLNMVEQRHRFYLSKQSSSHRRVLPHSHLCHRMARASYL